MVRQLFIIIFAITQILHSDSKRTLRDEALAFELELKSSQRFLSQKELASLHSEASAGTVASSGDFVSLLIIEAYPGLDLNTYVSALMEELPVENPEILYFDENTSNDRRVIEYGFRGFIQKQELIYHVEVFSYGNAFYQLVGYSYIDSKDKNTPDPKAKIPALRLIPGKTPKLKVSWSLPDYGQSWFVESSNYYNASFGIKMKLETGVLELVQEDLLSEFHSNAIAAWRMPDKDGIIYLIGFLEPLTETEVIQFWNSSAAIPGLIPVTSPTGSPFLFEKGAMKVRLRYLNQNQKTVLFVEMGNHKDSRLDYLLARNFHWLDSSELKVAIAKLKSLQRQIHIVSTEQSFGNNTYINRPFNLTFVELASDLVEANFIDGGLDSSYQLHLNNFTADYNLLVDLEEDTFADPSEYHQNSLDTVSAEVLEPTTQFLGTFTGSHIRLPAQTKGSWMFTRSNKDQRIRVFVHPRGKFDPLAFLKKFSFEPIRFVSKNKTHFRDIRLHYQFDLPPEPKRCTVITGPAIQAVGELIKIEGKEHGHHLLAINAPLLTKEIALDLFLSETAGKLYPEILDSSKQEYLGLLVERNSYRILFDGSEKKMIQETIKRGSTLFSAFTILPNLKSTWDFSFFKAFKFRPDILKDN